MTAHNITKADLDELRINDRQPRIFREPRDRDEARAILAQEHHVTNVAELQAARNALTQTICDLLGVTRRGVKLPQAHLVLVTQAGHQTARWEYEQREHVQAAVKEHGVAAYRIRISGEVQRGALAAWEAQQ